MEVIIPVNIVQIDYKCPKCERDFLRPTGNVLTTYPPQYPHKCTNPNCDYMETFLDKQYPFIMYNPLPIIS